VSVRAFDYPAAAQIRRLGQHGPRAARFSAVGIVGVGINTAVLYLLVAFGGWNHLAAAAVSTETAILCNFLLNDRWTFRGAGSRHSRPQRLLRYNAIALGGLCISLGVLAALTLLLGMHYLVANLIAIGAATVWNYVVNARITWHTEPLVTGARRERAALLRTATVED
jgi:dolichol-phosphate mannosyltransferase